MKNGQINKIAEMAVERIKSKFHFENFNVEFNIQNGVVNILATEKDIDDKFNEFIDSDLFDFDDDEIIFLFAVRQKNSILPSKAVDMIISIRNVIEDVMFKVEAEEA